MGPVETIQVIKVDVVAAAACSTGVEAIVLAGLQRLEGPKGKVTWE